MSATTLAKLPPLPWWECRLCTATGEGWVVLGKHLHEAHQVADGTLGDELDMRLHAAKDYPSHSENTFGLYNPPARLLAVLTKSAPRAADDPMRFERLP